MITLVLAISMVTSPLSSSDNHVEFATRIPQEQVAFAECVSFRESTHNYRAIGDNRNARGRWQFLDKQWRRGLSYMVASKMVESGMKKSDAKILRETLQKKSIDTWKPMYQDIGFVVALNAKGPWTGWKHWFIPGSKCNSLVPLDKR